MNNALIEYVVKENATLMKMYFELQQQFLQQMTSGSKKDLAELLDKLNDNNEYIYAVCGRKNK